MFLSLFNWGQRKTRKALTQRPLRLCGEQQILQNPVNPVQQKEHNELFHPLNHRRRRLVPGGKFHPVE